MDAAETLGKDVGLQGACKAMGVSRATLYRRRCRPTKDCQSDRHCSPRALSAQERLEVKGTLYSERFVDQSPREVYAPLLDEGQYLCSVRTMYRLLSEESASKERRNQLRHPNYKKPELLATGPNQVWSWDITKLLGPKKWLHYHLYVILDIYSRYVVGWMLAHCESASLASSLIRQTVEKQGVCEDQLTIHSDRGPSMKYRPEFPRHFGSYEDARSYCRSFFNWYNDEHYHSGIGLLTPAMLHYGGAEKIIAERAHVLQDAYVAHPERFVRGCPKPQTLPDAVWINPPTTTSEVDHGNPSPLLEIQTPSEPIRVKTEIVSLPLTSAEANSLLEVPGQMAPSLSNTDHEKRLPEIVDLKKPDAPLTHPRPGYPLASCVPTELASDSPGEVQLNDPMFHPQPPLNTRAIPEKIPGVRGMAPDELPKEETTMTALH